MSEPLVSVIVPVFNDAEFLAESLKSIARQTLCDFEVIVSDDCSSDHSRAVAEEFVRRDSRFRLNLNPVNLGMTGNWNTALNEARGRYLVKLDADDAFRDETLARLVDAMESDHAPVVAYCRTLSCDQNLVPISSYLGEYPFIRARIDPLQAHCRRGHEWYRLSFDDFQLWHSNAQMHRRTVLNEMGGWDSSWGCASDTDLILRVLERNESVCHVPYAGALYRQRAGSVSHQYRQNTWLRWESSLIHLDSLNRYYAGCGIMTSALRKAWWRHWQNWQALEKAGSHSLQNLREDIRIRLLKRSAQVAPPHFAVRLGGAMRQWIWNRLN